MTVRRLTESDGIELAEDTVQQRLRVRVRRDVVAYLADLADPTRADRGPGVIAFNSLVDYPAGSLGARIKSIITGIGEGGPWGDVDALIADLDGLLGTSVLSPELQALLGQIDAPGTGLVDQVAALTTAYAGTIDAAASAVAAAQAAADAAQAQADAIQAANEAAVSAGESLNQAEASETAKVAAQTAAGQASTSATSAASSATSAAGSASTAFAQAGLAATAASSAGTSATAAANSATSASSSATNAGTSATAANSSKLAAETAAGQASTSATSAASSATSAAGNATTASTSATNAANSATSAGNSASAAGTSASSAATSATQAGNSASAANQSKLDAASSATAAAGSATTAQNSATAANTSASSAATSAANAGSSATAANQSKLDAASSADAAAGSATAAQNSATAANTSASTAATSATNAGSSATAANQSKLDAASSADAAAGSATAAQNSAVASNSSANSATASANEAGSSATAANASKLAAQSSAGEAAGSASAASTSATLASTSASAAGTSATAAEASKVAAASSASSASASSGSAATAATNAAGSASAAASHYNNTVAATGTLTAAVEDLSEAIAGPNGVTAQNVLKVTATRADGKKVFGSIGVAATAVGDAGESQILLAANKLVFVPESDPNAPPVQALELGLVNGVLTLIVPAARIGDATIGPVKLSVPELSAITANVGTLTAGVIRNTSDTYRVDVTNGRTIVRTGSHMKVSGAPFGSAGQFIEWYGPYFADLSSCTEANGVYFLTTNGSGYFGGTLSAGVLKNSAQTTSTVATAEVVVGPFGTNGGSKSIVLSYEYGYFYTCNSHTGSIGGSGGATVALERQLNGGGWANLTTLTAHETVRDVLVDGEPGIKDTVRWALGGSVTVVDNSAATTNMVLRARVTSRTLPTFGGTGVNISPVQTQRMSVISTE